MLFFLRLSFVRKIKISPKDLEPVSVVICAKNEATNLRKNLTSILEQEFPDFEVILVDDHSDDATSAIAAHYKDSYPWLKVVRSDLSLNFPGKRNALFTGVREARNEIILITDADCHPSSSHWIQLMTSKISRGADVTLGYGPYEKTGGFFNKLVRFEAFWTAMQYFSFTLAGAPYMGTGRNLAYRKQLFMDEHGFEKADTLSGDDDLFINRLGKNVRFSIQTDPRSFMYSPGKNNIREWITQKTRHLQAGTKYKFHHLLLLGGLQLSVILLYLTGLFLLFSYPTHAVFLILIRTGFFWAVFFRPANILREKDLWWFLPFLDLIYLIFYTILAITAPFNNRQQWK